jgi:hypothetical protein
MKYTEWLWVFLQLFLRNMFSPLDNFRRTSPMVGVPPEAAEKAIFRVKLEL